MNKSDLILIRGYAYCIGSGLRFASSVGSYNLQSIYMCFQATHLVASQCSLYPKLFKQVEKIKFLLCALEFGSIIWAGGRLLNQLDPKYGVIECCQNLSKFRYRYSESEFQEMANRIVAKTTIISVAWIALAYISVKFINTYFYNKQQNLPTLFLDQFDQSDESERKLYRESLTEIEAGTLDFYYDRPFSEKIQQMASIAHLTIQVALLFLSDQKFFYACQAFMQGYSLLKLTERRWISTKAEFYFDHPDEMARKVSVIYQMLALPYQGNDNCAICQDAKPDVTFCYNLHGYHIGCLLRNINNRLDQKELDEYGRRKCILTDINIKSRERKTNISGTLTAVVYKIELPKKNLPCCPMCRTQPSSNECQVTIEDHEAMQEGKPTRVNLTLV